MPALAQDMADPDAVVRRAVGALGKEDNGGGVAHGSVVAPIPAVLSASGDLGGQAWGAKLRDPHGEVKAPSPRQKPSRRAFGPNSSTPGGITGRAASSVPSCCSTGCASRLRAAACPRDSGVEYARRQRGRIRDPGEGVAAGAVGKTAQPTDPVWTELARLAVTGGTAEGEQGAVVGASGLPGRDVPWRHCRAPRGRPVEHLGRRRRPRRAQALPPVAQGPSRAGAARGLTRVGPQRAPGLAGVVGYRRSGTVTALATAYAIVGGSGRLGACDRGADRRPRGTGGRARPPRYRDGGAGPLYR